jgi:hypothetical protein
MLIPAISGDLVLTQTCFGGVNIVKIYQSLNSTDFALNMKSLAPICCWMLGSEPNWHLLRGHASQSGIILRFGMDSDQIDELFVGPFVP